MNYPRRFAPATTRLAVDWPGRITMDWVAASSWIMWPDAVG